MPLVEISPDELAQLADQVEDEAYALLPGPARTDMLLQAFNMRGFANRAKWDDELTIKAQVVGPAPTGK